MNLKKIINLILCFVSVQFSYANSLSPVEFEIKEKILNMQNNQVKLLETLVNINSGTENIAGIHEVGEILKLELEKIGFKTRWINLPKNMHKASTLIAEHMGKSEKKLLLIAHLDTVFPKTSPFQKFTRKGNQATGPGVIDIKGGDIIILYALKALYDVHVLQDMNITVVFTGDEESSGKPVALSRQPLIEIAKKSNIALDFENSISLDTASIARRGISNWTIQSQGKEGHSSKIFDSAYGDGAIFEIVRALNAIRTETYNEHYFTFNPGVILGGAKVNYDKTKSEGFAFGKGNVIAKTGMATGDMRFISLEQKIKMQKKIKFIVDQHLDRTTAAVSFEESIPSMSPTKNNMDLLNEYSQVSLDLNQGHVSQLDPGERGGGDISYVASIMSANLVGLGASGTGAHSEQETIDLNSLPIQTQRAAVLMYRLTHK